MYTLDAPVEASNFRLAFTDGVGGNANGIRVREVRYIGTITGSSYLSGGTASADSEYSATTLAGAAFDDNVGTWWDGCAHALSHQ